MLKDVMINHLKKNYIKCSAKEVRQIDLQAFLYIDICSKKTNTNDMYVKRIKDINQHVCG